MSKAHDADFLENVIWYATDVEGKVAAFAKGEIPSQARAIVDEWQSVDDQVRDLSPISDYLLHISKGQYWEGVSPVTKLSPRSMAAIADRFWPLVQESVSYLPARGVYVFWGERRPDGWWPWTYRLACAPLSPIDVRAMPLSVQGIISSITLPIRFSEMKVINVREVHPE